MITESSFKGYSMTCGSKEKAGSEDKIKHTLRKTEKIDIQSSHAFSLLGFINDGRSKTVKIWDPWGNRYILFFFIFKNI